MTNLPRLCWTVAACLAFLEMLFSLQTFITGFGSDALLPGTNYLNLSGWIGLALYGTYYRISRRSFDGLDKLQVLLAVIGTLTLAAGTTITNIGGPSIPMLFGIVIQLVSMGLFAFITLKRPLPMLAV
ncbi:hypothetical protein [Thalassospira marina]|uniref:Uncharacterized protein n=1 Tax=Thalassospira marina TaxID=2048283 RepID=A0A2N3KYQ0_9PROT|nr:hypothetical protein [Thalassospira marina]AUG51775.1 hypothetical protein CSC3H3_02895 [Thalassospira marina]PKR55704.1 hypothetical protein COO20_00305 [Thalassospira marina]